jgi:hypothetical protein
VVVASYCSANGALVRRASPAILMRQTGDAVGAVRVLALVLKEL